MSSTIKRILDDLLHSRDINHNRKGKRLSKNEALEALRPILIEALEEFADIRVFNHAACALGAQSDGGTHGESCKAQTKLQNKLRASIPSVVDKLIKGEK